MYDAHIGSRVIELHASGISKAEISRRLSVSTTYINDALQRFQQRGALQAIGKKGSLHHHRKLDELLHDALRTAS